MTINERRKYLVIMQMRYLAGDKKERIVLLNEIQKVTGCHRKSLIRLMHSDLERKRRRKQRGRTCGREVDDAQMEVIITPGPRSAWDTGRQLVTPEGALSGLRFRGSDQLRYVITDIMRCIEIGFRGFLAIDEGLLWLLNEMRKNGDIPEDVVFKVSIYAGHASAAGARVLEMLGADTFNPVADLSLPQFASIRQASDIPLDMHIILTESFGGYNRFYDGPDMARVCAPCYFKIEPGPGCGAGPGALYKPWTSPDALSFLAREKVKYAQTIHELIQENYPEITMSAQGAEDLAIPQP